MAKRKNESKKINTISNGDSSLMDKLFIVLGVLLFILVFYLLTVYITNKNSSDTENDSKEKTVEISDEYIILGRSLSMSADDYLVIYYNNEDSISEIINTYRINGDLPIYRVDMTSAFNKKYVTDGESNKNPTKESEFKINGITLIRVSKNSVVEYIEGEEAIKNYLN